MNTYKIPISLEDKYKGAGCALAASANDMLVDICYLRDLLPFEDDSIDNLKTLIDDDRIAPTVRYFSGLGRVHIGMCSAWEFVEL